MGARAAPGAEARRGLLARWGDGLNPLVVKEVRQGLRTRVFWGSFGLMLLACLLLSLRAFAVVRESAFSENGQDFFLGFYTCLGVAHFFIIPYNAYRSLAREREDETWVLLVLTGLGPRRILRGKVASYLVQAGLYASAVAPFLLFSYYLNGIDLPTILLALVLGATWLVFLTVVGVCAATLADGRVGRALVHLLLLGALVVALIQGLFITFGVLHEGSRMLREPAFLAVLVGGLWLTLGYGWLFFETAAARLSLPTENYTRGPRRALAVQLLVTGGLLLLLWGLLGRDEYAVAVVSILGSIHLGLAGLFVATDADGQARVLRAGTRPWSLFRPGAVRGFRLVLVLVVVWTGLCMALLALSTRHGGARDQVLVLGVLVAPAYALLYLSLALGVGRLPRSDMLASPAAVRGLFFLLTGLAGVLFPLLATLVELPGSHPLVNLLNPFVGLVNFLDYDYGTMRPTMTPGLLACVWLVAGLAAFVADRALVERERRAHAA
jgi:hypothetical protein